MSKQFIEAKEIIKSYKIGLNPIPVLKGINLTIEQGEWVALLGASGSGKTTLLNMIGTLEKPDSGEILLENIPYSSMSKRKSVAFRCSKIGFIFQAYHMLPELTVLENTILPGMFNNGSSIKMKEQAIELLKRVGLNHRLTHRPSELSGGEQQRAAIARSLINSPELMLADEPTGNLDSKTGGGILEIFQELHSEKSGKTIIMVTHDRHVAGFADRIIELEDGKIINQE